MDIYCPRCGEPWDLDSLHEEAAVSDRTFQTVRRDFATRGCKALEAAFGATCAYTLTEDQSAMIREIYATNGDDVDGAAADLEDLASELFR